jgi:hypothetical protein
MSASINNSFTAVNLNAGQIVSGSIELVDKYASITVSCVNNGSDGELFIRFGNSNNGTFEFAEVYTILDQTPKSISTTVKSKYMLVTYENGTNTLNTLNIYTALLTGIGNNVDVHLNPEDDVVGVVNTSDNPLYVQNTQDTALYVNVGSISIGEVGLTGPVEIAPNQFVGITGPIGLTGPISGSVGLTGPIQIQTVQAISLPLNTAAGIAAYADTVPAPTADALYRSGWYYTNTNAGNKYNYYFYSNTGFTQTFADITGGCVVFQNDALSTASGLNPIFSLYSVGNLNVFFQSRKNYWSSQKLVPGQKYLAYWGVEPDIFPELPRVELTLSSVVGPALPTETILFMSIGSDSGAAAGTIQNLTTYAGWSNSSKLYLTEFIGTSNSINTPVQILNKLNSGLNVTLTGGTSTINIGNTGQFFGPTGEISVKVISGPSGLTGNQTVSNDGSFFGPTGSISVNVISGPSGLTGNQTVSNDGSFFGPTGEISVKVISGPSGLTGNQTVSNDGSFFGPTASISVNVISGPSGLTGNQTVSNDGSFFGPTGSISVNVISGPSGLTGVQTVKNDGSFFGPTGSISVNVISGPSGLTGNQTVSNDGSFFGPTGYIDNHCYGSSDGTVWHHLKTNPNGVLQTNAIVQSAAGTDITSHGANLDVWINNTNNIPVSNVGFTNLGNLDAKTSETNSLLTTQNTYLNTLQGGVISSVYQSNITNTSLDTHLYGYNGSAWTNITNNSAGYVNVANPELVALNGKISNISGGSTIYTTIANQSLAVTNSNIDVLAGTVSSGYVNTQSGLPTMQTMISGTPITVNTAYPSSQGVDLGVYNSADLLFLAPAGSVSQGGSLYLEVSPDQSNWYRTNTQVFPFVDNQNARTYYSTISPINTRYIRVLSDNQLTTLSTIVCQLSLKH